MRYVLRTKRTSVAPHDISVARDDCFPKTVKYANVAITVPIIAELLANLRSLMWGLGIQGYPTSWPL